MVILGFAVVVVIGAALAYGVVIVFRRFREPLDVPQPISLLVPEQVARSIIGVQAVAIALAVAAAVALSAQELESFAPLTLLVIGPAMIDAVIAGRVLRRIAKPGATAEVCGNVLLVRAGGRTARLATSFRAIARAKRRGLPAGVAR